MQITESYKSRVLFAVRKDDPSPPSPKTPQGIKIVPEVQSAYANGWRLYDKRRPWAPKFAPSHRRFRGAPQVYSDLTILVLEPGGSITQVRKPWRAMRRWLRHSNIRHVTEARPGRKAHAVPATLDELLRWVSDQVREEPEEAKS